MAIQNRQQALAQQEDAEAHCSAPYRRAAPARFSYNRLRLSLALACPASAETSTPRMRFPVVQSGPWKNTGQRALTVALHAWPITQSSERRQ